MDRVRNEEVRRSAGLERELASKADQRVLRWFLPYGQKGGDGRSQWGTGTRETEVRLTDGVKVALGNRGMTVEAVRQCPKDRKEWRDLAHM